LVDLGGVPYLIPSAQRDKIYDLVDIPHLIGTNDCLMIGAGAGPWFHTGTNCELMANLSVGVQSDGVNNLTRLATVDASEQRQQHQLPPTETRCALLSNLLVTKGQKGKVLMVECSERTGAQNFVTCMRNALNERYPDKAIGTLQSGGILANSSLSGRKSFYLFHLKAWVGRS
jgi:Domain of Unknown Function (DUF1907)